ncbi:MAG: FAD-linked oxidase C-terminal domain-containing protein [Xanthomonadales bacterium]|nr:FAD-linked oxidase C-terminal domain-containing protein [Xanthomonadales bacterium]
MNENRPLASCPPPALIEALQGVVGERVTLNRSIREHHSHDESWHDGALPDAVCFPESTEEVARIAKLCCEHRIPMIPFGTGTGVAGSVNAVGGGMTIDLSRMDRLLSVYADDFSCRVQAGLTYKRLNEQLRDTGLFFSVDPGADASVGGLAATRASGTNTVKYGSMRENVLSLTAVLADGRIVKTGSRARKSAAGYDLTQLFIGSEGTLGIITELIVRLHGRPAASASASVQFPDLKSAVDAVIATLQHNIPMARIELVDEMLLQAINRFSGTRFEPAPSLFVEFQGSDSSVREDAEMFGEICGEFGCKGFRWTANEQEARAMWEARHSAAYAFLALRPGAKNFSTDVCVPVSRLAECIEQTRADAEKNVDVIYAIAGHVGDGNFHTAFLVDPTIEEERKQVEAFYDRLVARALSMEGTCSGEHGIGMQKLKYMAEEFSAESLDVMRAIKSALDPQWLMNPGKKILRS